MSSFPCREERAFPAGLVKISNRQKIPRVRKRNAFTGGDHEVVEHRTSTSASASFNLRVIASSA